MASDKRLLSHLEDRLRDAGYALRYEKGHFRAGFCLVHERRVIVVNKFFDPAARLQTLREIVVELGLDLPAEARVATAAAGPQEAAVDLPPSQSSVA